jgi:hypothetical protein
MVVESKCDTVMPRMFRVSGGIGTRVCCARAGTGAGRLGAENAFPDPATATRATAGWWKLLHHVVHALGITAGLAKSFACIHRANLVNMGILPLVCNTDGIDQDDQLEIDVSKLTPDLVVKNLTNPSGVQARTTSPGTVIPAQ